MWSISDPGEILEQWNDSYLAKVSLPELLRIKFRDGDG
jgi:hypothetical protein